MDFIGVCCLSGSDGKSRQLHVDVRSVFCSVWPGGGKNCLLLLETIQHEWIY